MAMMAMVMMAMVMMAMVMVDDGVGDGDYSTRST